MLKVCGSRPPGTSPWQAFWEQKRLRTGGTSHGERRRHEPPVRTHQQVWTHQQLDGLSSYSRIPPTGKSAVRLTKGYGIGCEMKTVHCVDTYR